LSCVQPNTSPPVAGWSSPRNGLSTRGRGVALTWLATAAVIVCFEVVVLGIWAPVAVPASPGVSWRQAAFVLAGCTWLSSSAWLLWSYRRASRGEEEVEEPRGVLARVLGRRAIPVLACVAASTMLVAVSGMLLVGGAVMAQTSVLLKESSGARRRLSLAVVAVLGVLWLVDSALATGSTGAGASAEATTYALLLPVTSAFSLWWWDIVEQLDHARVAEGRLAATQERLRLANDVHDLQGHHLQVIALQLELAERLLTRDPDGALHQVRAARSSVDDARQGTRDLATRFRGVPLADELANAADLLRAAGFRVDLSVAHQAGQAPVDVLGPVIRETTTNMLKHSGGAWATLSLRRSGDNWTYTASNDVAQPRPGGRRERTGNGLQGIGERVRAVGGHVAVDEGPSHFTVSATVPRTEARPFDHQREGDR
jgi:two-component system sensor histidine kinase DesK